MYGAGRSPAYGVGLGIINQYFIPSARQTSLMILSGILGEAMHTAILGQLIENNHHYYLYYIGGLVILQATTVLVVPFACRILFTKSCLINSSQLSSFEDGKKSGFVGMINIPDDRKMSICSARF